MASLARLSLVAGRCFPAVFGCLRSSVRRLPGWPIVVRRAVGAGGMAQVDRAIRRIPLGCRGFRSDRRAAAVAGPDRRRTAAVVRGALLGFSLAALTFEIVDWWRRGGTRNPATRRPRGHLRWCCPASCICLVLFSPPLTWPHVRQSGVGRGRRTVRSPSPPCRATCRGSGWNSTPSAVPCSTTTSAKRCGWPRMCAPAGRRSRCSSSGRRTPRTSIRWPIRTPRTEISQSRRQAIDAPILVGGVLAGAGLHP